MIISKVIRETFEKGNGFSSVIPAMNGELAPEDEGMSYVYPTLIC